jgi:hypothetical protein
MNTFKKHNNPLDTLNIGQKVIIEMWLKEINLKNCEIIKNEDWTKIDHYKVYLYNVLHVDYRRLTELFMIVNKQTDYNDFYIDIEKYNIRVILWNRYELHILNLKNNKNKQYEYTR